MGKKTVSLASGTGKVGKLHVKSMKLEHILTSCTKINLKWQRLKHKTWHHKTRKEHRQTFSDINHTNVFLGLSSKTTINKWDLIKLTSFCIARETIKKKKITYGMGEDTCKWCNWQRLNCQNVQTTHTTTKNRNPNQKIDISSKKIYRWSVGTWKDAQCD